MPKSLKDHSGMPITQVGAEQPLPEFYILFLCPLEHGLLRHHELCAACCGKVFRQGDTEPSVPVLVYGLVYRGFRSSREQLFGFFIACILSALLIGEMYVLVATETRPLTVEIMVAARADGGEVQVVDFGRRAEALMPGDVVAVAEGDDVGQRVVVVDDEGEVAHRFIPIVCGYGEGTVGVGIFSDKVWVLDPVFLDILHPLDNIL